MAQLVGFSSEQNNAQVAATIAATTDGERFYVAEEFASGSISSASIGTSGWNFNGGTAAGVASEAGHPGIIRRDTSATINTNTNTALNAVNRGSLFTTDLWDGRMLFRLGQVDADTQCRVGVAAAWSSNPPADGAYLERLGTDTNWFFVTRTGGAQSRVDTGVAAGTGWVWGRIRRISATQVGFRIASTLVLLAGAVETTATTNLPTGGAMTLGAQLINLAAVAKTMDLDFADLLISGLVR